MRSSFWIIILSGALISLVQTSVHGQVKLEVVLDQEQFIQDETLPMEVRIKNLSGRPLGLGSFPGWLNFHVESLDGFLLAKRLRDMPARRRLVESSATATQRVDILPLYDLSRPGRYRVTAHLRIPGWEKEFASEPVKFDITKGVPIWHEDFGVPSTGDAPEVRRYALLRASYLDHPAIYVRVTDPSNTEVFNVAYLGGLVNFSAPEQKLDRLSRLHVLFQDGARSFNYNVVDPNGQLVVRQTHSYFKTRPQLRSQGGVVKVVGGVRRIARSDRPIAVKREIVPPAGSKP